MARTPNSSTASGIFHESATAFCNNSPTHILQWNCRGIINKRAELSLKLQKVLIPILALSEGALPGMESLPGYIKYTAPSIPSFPHGSAALYVHHTIPQYRIDPSSLASIHHGCVAVKVKLGKLQLTVASVYVRSLRSASCDNLLGDICALTSDSLVICGDFNAHHQAWGSATSNKRGCTL